MNRCLRCYGELDNRDNNYHPECLETLIGSSTMPQIPYTSEQIATIATKDTTPIRLSIFEPTQGEVDKQSEGDNSIWSRLRIYPSNGEVADVTMKLAEAAHIITSPHTLIRLEDNTLRYASRRVDVDSNGRRLPMENILQISELTPEECAECSYEQIMTLIEECSSVNRIDVITLWEQVVFAWICGNSSFGVGEIALYEPYDGICSLAPLCYANSDALFDPNKLGVMALKLDGVNGRVRRSNIESAMRNSGLKNRVINTTFKKFISARDRWFEIIDESLISQGLAEEYKRLIDKQLKSLEE